LIERSRLFAAFARLTGYPNSLNVRIEEDRPAAWGRWPSLPCAGRMTAFGRRPSTPAIANRPVRLHLSLFGDLQRVVDLDSEVSHGAFKFRMAEQELNGPKIPGATIDQSRLGSPH
jgi:hypothetical protein